MCGLAGLVSYNRQFSKLDIEKMTSTMMHRGPDGMNVWCHPDGHIQMGHVRMAVIDLSPAAIQPMHMADRYTIVCDGRIFNHRELKIQLEKKGYRFKTVSDTEVILAAFDCWRENCLQYFEGMFAFAIWDEQEKSLFAARDRFGQKPFYYTIDEETGLFAFASETKAFKIFNLLKEINERQLLLYLADGFTTDPTELIATFYKSIFQLPPGHFLWLKPFTSQGLVSIKCWWDLDKEHQHLNSEAEAIEIFTELFRTSLKKSYRSDIPVATCSSGGLNSSTILAFASTLDFRCSNKVFGASNHSAGSTNADEIFTRFELKQFNVTPTEWTDELKQFFYYQDEPVCSPGIFEQYKVFQLAKSHNIHVLLDEYGADQTLAGYSSYLHWFLQEMLMKDRKTYRKEKNALRANGVRFKWDWRNYLAAIMPAHAALHLEKRSHRQIRNSRYFNRDFFSKHDEEVLVYQPFVGKLNDLLYFNVCQGELQEKLRYADRNAYANGCEVRSPFLDHHLVQYIFSLPSNVKIRDGHSKWILRKAVEKILPPEIAWQKEGKNLQERQIDWKNQKGMKEMVAEAKANLVNEKILDRRILNKKNQPRTIEAADGFDWRCLSAAQWLQMN